MLEPVNIYKLSLSSIQTCAYIIKVSKCYIPDEWRNKDTEGVRTTAAFIEVVAVIMNESSHFLS